MSETKTVAEMSEREQIERLLRQRNELWALIDQLITEHGSNEERTDFLRSDDLPHVECEVEDGQIIVVVENVLERLSSVRFDIDRLATLSEEIVGNTYVVEGRNHQTAETNPDSENNRSFELYVNAEGGWWVKKEWMTDCEEPQC